MPRFVVLRHEMPEGSSRPSHWDFMLEDGPVLRTWAIDRATLNSGAGHALQLSDHRLEYLEFEGDISGNRGRVTRFDRGEYEILERNELLWRVNLIGTTFRGECTLVRNFNDTGSLTFQFAEP